MNILFNKQGGGGNKQEGHISKGDSKSEFETLS